MKGMAGRGTVLGLCLALGPWAQAEARPPARKGANVSRHASGTFEVKVAPLPTDEKVPGLAVGRMSLQKQFSGDLVGQSVGEMMTAETAVEGSGAYVALERVTGTLQGRRGSFVVSHQGTMRRGGEFDLVIKVVPDSGTDQLAGLSGTMAIQIAGGKHSYEVHYTLPDSP
jgi:hypothetical protein